MGQNKIDRRHVEVIKMSEENSDFKYWKSLTPLARLEILAEIRREFHGWKNGAEPRFKRVYRVIKFA